MRWCSLKKIMIVLIIIVFFGIGVLISNQNHDQYEVNTEEKKEMMNEPYVDELTLSVSEVDTFQPLRTKNAQVANLLKLVYEPLFDYAADESLEKVLAQNASKINAKTWIVTMKNYVLWHDGRRLGADDAIFTIQVLMNHDLLWSDNVTNIERIEKLDHDSIKFYLKEPDDYFIHQLIFPIIPKHYFEGAQFWDEKKAANMNGTGPYQFVEATSASSFRLEFYQNWWKDSLAKLNRINVIVYPSYGEAIKGFKSASVDMMVTNMVDWKEKFGVIGLNSYGYENSEYELVIPNHNVPSLQDKNVRKALLLAINREGMINDIYHDNARIADLPIHFNSQNNVVSVEYSLERAKQLLMNGGWLKTENGWQKEIEGKTVTLKYHLLVNKNSSEKMRVAQYIKNNFEELGVPVEMEPKSLDEIKKVLKERTFDLVLLSIDVKGECDLIESVKRNGENNFAGFFSNDTEDYIERMTIDDEMFRSNFPYFILSCQEECPYLGLYFKTSTILTNKSVKGNFNPTWNYPYRNIVSFCK